MDRQPPSESPRNDPPVNRIASFVDYLGPPAGSQPAAVFIELESLQPLTPEMRVKCEEELKELSTLYGSDPTATSVLKDMIRLLYRLGDYEKMLPFAEYFRSQSPQPDPEVEAMAASARQKLRLEAEEGLT